jgi:hypothetical protein
VPESQLRSAQDAARRHERDQRGHGERWELRRRARWNEREINRYTSCMCICSEQETRARNKRAAELQSLLSGLCSCTLDACCAAEWLRGNMKV